MNIDKTLEVLRYAAGDWLFLSHVRRIVTDRPPTSQDLSADIDATLEILEPLLRTDCLEVGDVHESDGFRRWPGSDEGNLERLRREWLEFGHEINMGDVAWFSLTESGCQRLRQLEAAANTVGN